MKYESSILKRLIDVYGVVGNPRYISEIIKQFIVQGKECYPNLFTYQSDWLAHIDEFGLTPEYTVSYTGQQIYAPNTKEKPVKRAILTGSTKYRDIDTGEILETFEEGRNLELVSVKMPVLMTHTKNLINPNECMINYSLNTSDGTIRQGTYMNNYYTTGFIPVVEGKTYVRCTDASEGVIYDKDKNYLGQITTSPFTIPTKGRYIRVMGSINALGVWEYVAVDGELTSYEPHKSNILTVNEDVTLRGIEDVQDTLDCLTGEVSERIREVVLNGSENWSVNNSNNGGFYSASTTTYIGKPNGAIISDKLPTTTTTKAEGVMVGVSTGKVMVSFNRDSTGVTNLNSFVEKLAQNPITILYELETESIKTVGLTIHDKDQQKVERLASFEGGTHFTTSSQEGSLLPSLTVDVVTNLEETLKVCSLEGNTM